MNIVFVFQTEAGEIDHMFHQIVIKFVRCCTILLKALLQKEILLENRKKFIEDWSLDAFLYQHKTRLEYAMKNGTKFRIMYPGYRCDTNLKEWDLEMTCLVLTTVCKLNSHIHNELKDLQDLKHTLITLRERHHAYVLDCRLEEIMKNIADYIGTEQLKDEIENEIKSVKELKGIDERVAFKNGFELLQDWQSEQDTPKNFQLLNGRIHQLDGKMDKGMISNRRCFCVYFVILIV